jgi:hypothetical protein
VSAFPVTRELHAAIDYELERMADAGRAVRTYHLADLGVNLIAAVFTHRQWNVSGGEDESRHTVIVWRWSNTALPAVVDRQRVNEWPL